MVMMRTRDIREKDGLRGQRLLQSLSNVDRSDSRMNEFRNPRKPLVEDIKNIKKDELLLGTLDQEGRIPVTIPYDGKSKGILIVAEKGRGKTQLMKSLAFDQFHARYDFNIFAVNPKAPDLSNLDQAMARPDLVQRLARFNIKPKAYHNAVYFKPVFFNMAERRGKEYILSPRDFDSLDYGERSAAIQQFFKVNELTPAARRALTSILSKGVPKTIEGLFLKLQNYRKDLMKQRISDAKAMNMKGGSKVMSFGADSEIRDKVNRGLLGDDGQKIVLEMDELGEKVTKYKTVHTVDFPIELALHRIVVLQADLENENDWYSSCYLRMALSAIWQDRYKYIQTHRQQGVVDRPTLVLEDEADVLMPSGISASPSRDMNIKLLAKGRQYGWSVMAATQLIESISKVFVKHCDIVITTSLQDPKLIEVVRTKYGLQDFELEELKHLEVSQKKPNQWVCFTPNTAKKFVSFYPLPPGIAMVEEEG